MKKLLKIVSSIFLSLMLVLGSIAVTTKEADAATLFDYWIIKSSTGEYKACKKSSIPTKSGVVWQCTQTDTIKYNDSIQGYSKEGKYYVPYVAPGNKTPKVYVLNGVNHYLVQRIEKHTSNVFVFDKGTNSGSNYGFIPISCLKKYEPTKQFYILGSTRWGQIYTAPYNPNFIHDFASNNNITGVYHAYLKNGKYYFVEL